VHLGGRTRRRRARNEEPDPTVWHKSAGKILTTPVAGARRNCGSGRRPVTRRARIVRHPPEACFEQAISIPEVPVVAAAHEASSSLREAPRHGPAPSLMPAAVGLAAFGTSSPPPLSPPDLPAAGPGVWVKDGVHSLDISLPDADSDHCIIGSGTADGARTVIGGRVPDARDRSFTAHPVPSGSTVEHVHDPQIPRSHGRCTVTLSPSCAGVTGTCPATRSSGPAGGSL